MMIEAPHSSSFSMLHVIVMVVSFIDYIDELINSAMIENGDDALTVPAPGKEDYVLGLLDARNEAIANYIKAVSER